jgi:hypothetical protein
MRSFVLLCCALLGAQGLLPRAAHADVYLEITNGNDSTGQLSGTSGIDISGLQVGAYTIGAGDVSTTANNPLALDFTNFSTTGGGANPGVLQIIVCATDLTAPIGSVINFLTQATGNVLDGTLISMTVQTYVDTTNAIDGMQHLLSTMFIGQHGAGSQYNQQIGALFQLLKAPFSETFVIDLQLSNNADISGDTDMDPQISEPAALTLFGTALLAMCVARRRLHPSTGRSPVLRLFASVGPAVSRRGAASALR